MRVIEIFLMMFTVNRMRRTLLVRRTFLVIQVTTYETLAVIGAIRSDSVINGNKHFDDIGSNGSSYGDNSRNNNNNNNNGDIKNDNNSNNDNDNN